MQPGWYPDPDDDQARRYWDGANWSAPLPIAQPSQASTPATAATAPGVQYKTCATGPCNEPRAMDSDFCTRHSRAERGLKGMTSAYSSALVCPHCQVRGMVKSKKVKQKKGVSGGKATAGLLTAGVSLLAVGLSRKEAVTEMRCASCGTVWYV